MLLAPLLAGFALNTVRTPTPRMLGVTRRAQRADPLRQQHLNSLAGDPLSPSIDTIGRVLVRYMYDGGTLAQGRLCELELESPSVQHFYGIDVLRALQRDGVNLQRFYACVRETRESGGTWLPLLRELGEPSVDQETHVGVVDGDLKFPLPYQEATPTEEQEQTPARRVDVKLFRRDAWPSDAARAECLSQPSGKIPRTGYFGVAVVGAKNENNIGTLWRSAYQLGAAFLVTIGARYQTQPTDTVHATSRVPLFELSDWSGFAAWAPRGARWVAVEMGGTPLEDFEHPLDAVYLLGSEDAGLPTSVLRACHDVVSLSSEQYASYNLAVAGSILMYDRMAKLKKAAGDARSVGKGTPHNTPARHQSRQEDKEATGEAKGTRSAP